MASIYRRSRSYPVPAGAEIIERRRKATQAELRSDPTRKTIVERAVKWTDRNGRQRRGLLSEDGTRVRVESGSYLISYFDANGDRQEVNAKTTDGNAAEQIANKLEAEVALRKRGIIDAAQERFSAEAQRPIADHVTDFRASLIAKGNMAKHVEMTETRVRRVIHKGGISRVTGLSSSRVQAAVKGIRDKGRSLETANAYLRAIKSFSRWLWRDRRTPDDRLVALDGYNTSIEAHRHAQGERECGSRSGPP